MTKKARHAPVRDPKKENARRRKDFYAWLGEVLSTGMASQDFLEAQKMFDQGISVKAMKEELNKPQNRRRRV